MATRTLAADVPVSQEMARLLVVELLAHLLDELPVVIQLAEEIARQFVVRLARCAAIDVEGNAEALEAVLDEVMVAIHHLLHRDALLAGTDGDRHTVLIASTDEQALAALQPQVARINVSRHIDASQMTDMNRPVCIR